MISLRNLRARFRDPARGRGPGISEAQGSGRGVALTRRTSPASVRERRERQRRFWRAKYLEDPAFFGSRESEFARWCRPLLERTPNVHEVVELGCGYGRDTRYLASCGLHVRGVDLVGPLASSRTSIGPPCEYVESDCLEFLRGLSTQSLDAVYSNMFFNMDFTEPEHRRLMQAVHAALRPGGLHLYSVRSTSDPWFGRGKKVGRDTFDPAPHGVTMHYFSEAYARRLTAGRFVPVQHVERREGEDEFPIVLWYFADRRDR